MTQTFTLQQNRAIFEENGTIHWKSKRIGLLYNNELSGKEFWDTLEDIREGVRDCDGQYISLDLADSQTETLPEMFYAALKKARWERSLQFSLPMILQHNPKIAAPFLSRAILWQRLCDLLIVDDDPRRKTVMVMENIDQASSANQHELVRLIRFHTVHSIHRTFIFTLNDRACGRMISELGHVFGISMNKAG